MDLIRAELVERGAVALPPWRLARVLLGEEPELRACPGCGAEVSAGMKFCTECGTKLDAGQSTVSYAPSFGEDLEPGTSGAPKGPP